jgi:hypothetical protein
MAFSMGHFWNLALNKTELFQIETNQCELQTPPPPFPLVGMKRTTDQQSLELSPWLSLSLLFADPVTMVVALLVTVIALC